MTEITSSDAETGPETPEDDAEATRAGFVAILGAPNAGKSTLVNALVGTKVTIVSPKVQTTRSRVRGIAMAGNSQVIFVDTPGIFHNAKRRLERAMVAAAWDGAADADEIVLVIDAERGIDKNSRGIIDALKENQRKDVLLVLNKIDAIERPALLGLTEKLFAEGIFSQVFMISALKGDGVADLLADLAGKMPEGPWLFPEDEVSDLPARMLASELTREKAFRLLNEELPYSLAVGTDKWEEKKDGSVRIEQTIYVQREAHRIIVLGKEGSKIKQIGTASRKEMEHLLERRVHLFLHVKVQEDWSEKRGHYTEWGLDFDA